MPSNKFIIVGSARRRASPRALAAPPRASRRRRRIVAGNRKDEENSARNIEVMAYGREKLRINCFLWLREEEDMQLWGDACLN